MIVAHRGHRPASGYGFRRLMFCIETGTIVSGREETMSALGRIVHEGAGREIVDSASLDDMLQSALILFLPCAATLSWAFPPART